MDTMLQRITQIIGSKHGGQKLLADAIGVPSNLISDWKGGRSQSYPKYAPQIAEYYGVSLDWLCPKGSIPPGSTNKCQIL